MKKTKFVTSYYPFHSEKPFWGNINRDRWYKYSLNSICNTGVEVVCYTDERGGGYANLLELKEKFNLSNLTLKIFPLENNPWQEKIVDIRLNKNPQIYNNPDNFFYGVSVQIYWMKWKFIEMELEEEADIYWIDCGLSHHGLFPKSASTYGLLEGWDQEFINEGPYSEMEYRFYYYDKAFNPNLITHLANFNEDKIINISRRNVTDNDIRLFCSKIGDCKASRRALYPVGGLWGGAAKNLKKYILDFYEVGERVLATGDFLCSEQEIMWYLNHKNENLFKNFEFDTFYHEGWDHYSSDDVSFSDFFTKMV